MRDLPSFVRGAACGIALLCFAAVVAGKASAMPFSAHPAERTMPSGRGVLPALVGSSNPAIPDMPIVHPNETPCVVQLFHNFTFIDFSPHPFTYTPTCAGPWAKVILKANFNVTAGIQFDRTGSIWIGPTNLYFGTTAEPSPTVSPSWHIERDVTDLTALLAAPSGGQIILGNIVNSQYTGIISASARLEFYAANTSNPAPQTPDVVLGLSAGPTGGNVSLVSSTDHLSGTFTLPQNIERAYLDVYLQSQHNDEFWYTCFPNDLATQLNNCGNTAFREGEVTIDGQPAGVAPIYPWIFTGGIDPFLWTPIAGVQTFNFTPYRMDITPFAGILNNGQQHTVAVSIYNVNNYFDTNGTLLLYLDKKLKQVSGGIIANSTASAPTVNVVEKVKIDSQGNARGVIKTTAAHQVYLDGYVNTSHGRVETVVSQLAGFSNDQKIDVTATQYLQDIRQQTSIASQVSRNAPSSHQTISNAYNWPLTLNYDYVVNADGSATQTTDVHQAYTLQKAYSPSPGQPALWSLVDKVHSSDVLTIANGSITNAKGSSTGSYIFGSSWGRCYNRQMASTEYVLTVWRLLPNCI